MKNFVEVAGQLEDKVLEDLPIEATLRAYNEGKLALSEMKDFLDRRAERVAKRIRAGIFEDEPHVSSVDIGEEKTEITHVERSCSCCPTEYGYFDFPTRLLYANDAEIDAYIKELNDAVVARAKKAEEERKQQAEVEQRAQYEALKKLFEK